MAVHSILRICTLVRSSGLQNQCGLQRNPESTAQMAEPRAASSLGSWPTLQQIYLLCPEHGHRSLGITYMPHLPRP